VPSLIVSGQHPGLDPAEYGLRDYPAIVLDCPGDHDPHAHVRRVTAALLPLLRSGPDLLVVQGDTSSALGAALAGFGTRTPVAHVEAGLRTHDPALPWPEEEYRAAIDAQADLLFEPTETAAANLRAERVPGAVHVTGNTGVDALLAVESRLPPRASREANIKRILVTCHRRESWGAGLESIAAALVELARRPDVRIEMIPHLNPHISLGMSVLLQDKERIALIPPCGHAELIGRVRDADLVLSDSGGLQEETPALGVPLLVLREKTERPEGLASGNARLVGTSKDRILSAAGALLDDPAALAAMARRSFPYGDGRAAPRIAAIIDAWLGGIGQPEAAAS